MTFINADLIALGFSVFRPEQAALRAGRLMLELIEQHVARGDSLAFEATLAGRSFAKSIPNWRGKGYAVAIYYLALPTVEHALERVAVRVQQGGTTYRRMSCGRGNFEEVWSDGEHLKARNAVDSMTGN